jgi:hypothetical protein
LQNGVVYLGTLIGNLNNIETKNAAKWKQATAFKMEPISF